MSNDFGNIVYLLMLLALVGGGFFATGKSSQNIQYLLIWAGVILVLVLGYNFYERQKFTPSQISEGEYNLVIPYDQNYGGYRTQLKVNGAMIEGIIDTGATQFVLTSKDAKKAGLDPQSLRYTVEVSTANGVTKAAPATINQVNFGDVFYDSVPVLVAQDSDLETSLIGQTLLRQFQEIGARDDRFYIRF